MSQAAKKRALTEMLELSKEKVENWPTWKKILTKNMSHCIYIQKPVPTVKDESKPEHSRES